MDFFASWCGPCKRILPKIEKLCAKYTNVTFLKINIETLPKLAKQYNVKNLPTFLLLNNNQSYPPVIGADSKKIKELLSNAN
jgi:thioredoxin 1